MALLPNQRRDKGLDQGDAGYVSYPKFRPSSRAVAKLLKIRSRSSFGR